MEDYQEAMVKSLVAVAWADGRVEAEETEVIEALLSAFEISQEDSDKIREYAKSPRSLDDIPITDLSAADRRVLLQHAVILTYIDGKQSEEETKLLGDLVAKLRVPADEAKEILAAADERAKRLLAFL
jgi:tellurite resistance protein